MNTKLHAITDMEGRLIRFFMTASQVSNCMGAAALPSSLPWADWTLADRVYDANWFGECLKNKGMQRRIPGRSSRGKRLKHDERRNKIEITFARPKDWRLARTRYDRGPKTFRFAAAVAATVRFWL